MRCLILSLVLLSVLTMVIVPTVVFATPPAKIAKAPRYELAFSANPTPTVGQVVTLSLRIRALTYSPGTKSTLLIAENVEVLRGEPIRFFDLSENEVAVHSISLKMKEEGRYSFFANVGVSTRSSPKFALSALAELHISSSKDRGEIFQRVDQDFYRTEDFTIQDGVITKIRSERVEGRKLGKTAKTTSTISVSGTIKYLDENTSSYIPLPYVKARITNYVIFGPNGPYPNPYVPHSTETTTDANGHYSVSGWPAGNTMVQVLMDNTPSYISNDEDGRFPETNSQDGAQSNVVLNVNINYNEPARILHWLRVAYDWCNSKLGWTPGRIAVKYYSGTGNHQYSPGSHIKYYYNPVGDDNDIWDPDNNGDYGKFLIPHEYGHHVMYKVYGDNLPPGGGPHDINQVVTATYAWNEGWADFFGNAVNVTESYNKFAGYFCIYHDLERNPNRPNYSPGEEWWEYPFWQGQNGQNTNGEYVEGSIASLLWDIYDSGSTQDGLSGDDDPVSGLISDTWNVLKNGKLSSATGQRYHAQTVWEFKYIWDDDAPNPPYIWTHAPGSQSIDAIYTYDLFGDIHVPELFSTIQAG